MKRVHPLLYTLLLIIGGTISLSAQHRPQSETALIALSPQDYSVRYQPSEQSLTIELDLTPYSEVKSQELLCIYPVYRSKSGKHESRLAPIYIVGQTRHKQIMRNKLLRNSTDITSEIISRPREAIYAMSGDVVTPRYTIPYERWMGRGELRLYVQRYGCASCPSTLYAYHSAEIRLSPYNYSPYSFTLLRPADETTKEYTKSFNSYVRFDYDSSALITTPENAVELDRLYSFIESSQQEEGVRLSKLIIEGYTSPEGTLSYNQRLSEARAQALYDYVDYIYPQLPASVEVVGRGEDIAGLQKLISASTLANKDQVLSILRQRLSDTQRDDALRQLDNYDQLVSDYYPLLRRTTFTMSYQVGAFTTEELPSVYAKNPLLLKQSELYHLAEQAVKRGDSPVAYLRSAYEQYPKDPVAILNYAQALLEYDHDAEQAYQLLYPIRTDARATLPLSIAQELLTTPNP